MIDNGEYLSTIRDISQDFVIANHFFEHCQDPIGALETFTRVLRPGGTLYMAVPDMRSSFDRDRALTPLSHFVVDYDQGPQASRAEHFREWVTLVEPHFGRYYSSDNDIATRVSELMKQDYSIHFHTFTPESMHALLAYCADVQHLPITLVFGAAFDDEMIFILRKSELQPENENRVN